MEYELNVEFGQLDCMKLAIITERDCGETREIHCAEPVLKVNGNNSNILRVTIKDADAIMHADKVTLSALLHTGGITAQAYLLKSHITTHKVARVVNLYTCNYDKRIADDIKECIAGVFEKDVKRTARQLLRVKMRLVKTGSTSLKNMKSFMNAEERDSFKRALDEHNRIVQNETDVMMELDRDVKRAVIRRMSDMNAPMVEVVLVRAPQKLAMAKRSSHRKSHVLVKSMDPKEFCIPRSAYLSLAIGNTMMSRYAYGEAVPHGECNIAESPIHKRAFEVLDLVNTASEDLNSALMRVGDDMLNTRDMLHRYSASIGGKPAHEKGWVERITGLSALHPLSDNLVSHLWIDLMASPGVIGRSETSSEVVNFFILFMPLNHGEFGPTSTGDPYQLDQSFIPYERGGGKLVGMELFFNSDCETLASRCLSHWRAQRKALDGYLEQPDRLHSVVAGADEGRFMAFILEMITMAAFPGQALIQCTTNMGEHVTHCRFNPIKLWKDAKDKGMCDIYTDAVSLRKDCKRVVENAILKFNTEASRLESVTKGKVALITTSAKQIFAKGRALYGTNNNIRVQDCTVECKTPNSFGFYNKLVGFYPYVHKEHRVNHFAPSTCSYDPYDRDFKQTLEACLTNPNLMSVQCDSVKCQQDVAALAQLQKERLEHMRT